MAIKSESTQCKSYFEYAKALSHSDDLTNQIAFNVDIALTRMVIFNLIFNRVQTTFCFISIFNLA